MVKKLAIGRATPRQICMNLCKISLSFFVLHIVSESLINFYGVSESFYQDFFDAINLDEEFNLPAIYSGLLLFFCSLLLRQISISCKKSEKLTEYEKELGKLALLIDSICQELAYKGKELED